MLKWLLIAAGGAFGSVMRYAVQGWVQRLAPGNFPLGTLAVNALGCLIIGFLAAILTGPVLVRDEYRIGLTVGVLGGFTTFSAFGLDCFTLINAGQLGSAALNIALSCGLGVVGVWAGFRFGQYWCEM